MLSTSAEKEEIFRKVKSSFSDYSLFDPVVATKLREAVRDIDTVEINPKTTEKVAERYFDVKSFKTPEQKLALTQIELIFKTSYILFLSHKEENKHLLWFDVKQLLTAYPEFVNADPAEQQLLLRYRNAVRIALTVIPARRNKALIMKIAERLEGSQKDYITGGGQSMEVKRRVLVYEQEGQISAEKRPPRERHSKLKHGERISTSNIATFSVKRAKLVRLQSEEVSALLSKDPSKLAFLEAPPAVIDGPPVKNLATALASSTATAGAATASNAAAAATVRETKSKLKQEHAHKTVAQLSPLDALSLAASSLLPLDGSEQQQQQQQPEDVNALSGIAQLGPECSTRFVPEQFPLMRGASLEWARFTDPIGPVFPQNNNNINNNNFSSSKSNNKSTSNSTSDLHPAFPGLLSRGNSDTLSSILAVSELEFKKYVDQQAPLLPPAPGPGNDPYAFLHSSSSSAAAAAAGAVMSVPGVELASEAGVEYVSSFDTGPRCPPVYAPLQQPLQQMQPVQQVHKGYKYQKLLNGAALKPHPHRNYVTPESSLGFFSHTMPHQELLDLQRTSSAGTVAEIAASYGVTLDHGLQQQQQQQQWGQVMPMAPPTLRKISSSGNMDPNSRVAAIRAAARAAAAAAAPGSSFFESSLGFLSNTQDPELEKALTSTSAAAAAAAAGVVSPELTEEDAATVLTVKL